jgi:2-polyprenyl-6-methoxyphenol hydroxylase-like FAD-dependent oxidoreductase
MSQEGEECIATARWVVDASGRANIMRRKLGVGEGVDTGHHCNAAWIRLAGGLDFEDWTDEEEWLGRMPEKGLRIHSTSHLIQPGYWLWLIQLESGWSARRGRSWTLCIRRGLTSSRSRTRSAAS